LELPSHGKFSGTFYVRVNSKLYIGNLSPGVSDEDLRQLFSRTGAVVDVTLMLDPATSQSRGFAFVTMATPELAAAALSEYHGYNIGGRYITVTEARPPEEPKGQMSEGFGLGESTFRPGAQRKRTGGRSSNSPRRRRR